MGIKTLKPTSAGRRFMTLLTFDEITKSRPEKSLVVTKKRTGGRNSQGGADGAHCPKNEPYVEGPSRGGHVDDWFVRLMFVHFVDLTLF